MDGVPAAASAGRPLGAWIGALDAVGAMARDPSLTLAGMLDELALRHGERPALLGADGDLSYRALAARANRVAHWARARCAGSTVGLLLPNRPDFVALWLGLIRAGCTVALLKPELAGAALRHCIEVAGCRLVLADDALLFALEGDTPVLALSELDAQLGSWPDTPAPCRRPRPSDPALLVFTSGTTGLPKAAHVSHGRITEWSLWFAGMMRITQDDRIYDCLPLAHSTGGIVAIGAALVRGASVLIAPGFSAGRFWDDVVGHGCTVFFYIGELCRYLLQSQPSARERSHCLRLACGNGLGEAVWAPFRDRFAIPEILEFYAATEGSVSLYNCEGRPGAIGRVLPFLAARFPLALVRIDAETGEPLRGADGLCVLAGVDEPGEALGRVEAGSDAPARRFDGYTDPDATARKLIRDVLEPGDCWFRSGDLMRRDAAGFYFFVDRLGDTFRWKGENVSTGEVAAAVRSCPGVRDAVVYGVRVPGQEGRAGMAALVADKRLDLAVLRAHLATKLPPYAQPLFLRLCRSLDLTGTFKLATARLQAEGYAGLADPVWFLDRAVGRYVPCDAGLQQALADGRLRC